MSVPSRAAKKPANDLISFDISKRSPEQIAEMFARWKERRKTLERTQQPKASRPRPVRFVLAAASAPEPSPPAPDVIRRQHPEPRRAQYSADFAAILAAEDGRTVPPPLKELRLTPADLELRSPVVKARSSLRSVLVGAASVIAVAAFAGAAVWPERETSRAVQPAAVAAAPTPVVPAAGPRESRSLLPILAAATSPLVAEARDLEYIVEAALARPAENEAVVLALMPKLKPPAPAVQTASQAAAAAEPVLETSSGAEPSSGLAIPARVEAAQTGIAAAAVDATRTDGGEEADAPTDRRTGILDTRSNSKDWRRYRADTVASLPEDRAFESATASVGDVGDDTGNPAPEAKPGDQRASSAPGGDEAGDPAAHADAGASVSNGADSSSGTSRGSADSDTGANIGSGSSTGTDAGGTDSGAVDSGNGASAGGAVGAGEGPTGDSSSGASDAEGSGSDAGSSDPGGGDTDGGSDGAGASGSGSEAGGSDVGGSGAGGADTGGADAGGSDAGGSDAGGADAGGADAGGSDAGGADTGGSDAGGSDAGGSDASGSDGGAGGSDSDSGGSNGGNSNSGSGSGGDSDSGGSDAGDSDGGGSDSGSSDGGDSDGGESDGGSNDSESRGRGLGSALGGAIGGARDAIGGALGGARDALGGKGKGKGKGESKGKGGKGGKGGRD